MREEQGSIVVDKGRTLGPTTGIESSVPPPAMDRANLHLMRIVAGMGALAMTECAGMPSYVPRRPAPKRERNAQKKRERKAQKKARRAGR